MKEMYSYISARAACDPCRTIYLLAPSAEAASKEKAEEFAIRSGWQALAEESGSVLVVPVISGEWKKEPKSLLFDLYAKTRNQFASRGKEAIWGRAGKLWCWETMLYLAAYEDGAVFGGNLLVQYPNMFAAAALVGGTPDEYSPAEELSNHWLVPEVLGGYCVRNREIPVHLWMMGEACGEAKAAAETAMEYFSGCYGSCKTAETELCGWKGRAVVSKVNPAWQVRVFDGNFSWKDKSLNRMIFEECFERVIRWKNGPDGTLALVDSKKEFYEDPRFLRRTVSAGGREYDYFVHLPKGKTKEMCKGLPLVFTVHGRGEPSWLFMTKNGWDTLADETGEFVLVSPDSPGNIWFLLRDGQVFPEIVHAMKEEFLIDTDRIYLTGFSNGGMIVREIAVSYPHLFAGVSPWNAPAGNTSAMMKEDSSRMLPEYDKEFTRILEAFLKSGFEMPCAFIFGDRDKAAQEENDLMIKPMAAANGCVCVERAEEKMFSKASYKNGEGKTRVTVTVMRNMPHGAVCEESRWTWEFLRRFRRRDGGSRVEEIVR